VFGSPVAGRECAGDVGCLNGVAGEGGWSVAAVTVCGVAGPVSALLEGGEPVVEVLDRADDLEPQCLSVSGWPRSVSQSRLSPWSAPGWVEALEPGRVSGYGTPEEVLR
jgi:hypothetical protein